jgi:hypothetical protein
MKLALSDAAVAAASVIGRCGPSPSPSCRKRVPRSAAPRNKICQRRTHICSSRHCGCCRSRSWFTVNPAAARIGTSLLGRHAWFAEYFGRAPSSELQPTDRHPAFQKRNRSPTVGAMLLRRRKPDASPPFT